MPITHGWTTAASDDPAYDVSAGELNAHSGTNDHAHTATGDGGILTSPEVSAKLLLDEQGSDPASPAATKWVLFVKSGGVYAKNSAGTVVGPLAAGGGTFATPTIALGSAAAAGAASSGIRSDSTIAAFDATVPTTQAFGDAAAVGSAAFAARRDHKHAMMALPAIDATAAQTDITTRNVTSTAHGLAPKSPADATQFLNGAATPAFAAVKDSDLATTDITTNNASTTKHGFTPKYPNDATKYLDGTGAYTVPPAASGMTDPMTTRGDIIIRNASNVTARLGHGTAGQVLGTDGTDVAWAAGSGGSGGRGEYASKYNPDHETPATAVADQEEFNTSTGMAWTGAPATDDLSTYPGFYRFKGDTTERHLSKAWTPGASDITIAAKFSISRGATDTGGPGLYVGDTTGNPANGVYVFFVPTSATNGFKLFNENGAGTFAELGTSQAIPNLQPWQSVYLRLTRAITGPVWTAYWSRDGVTWFAHPTTGSKSLTVGAYGIRMDNNHDISLDWIRVWTSIVSKVGA